jgi:hypothetical protein
MKIEDLKAAAMDKTLGVKFRQGDIEKRWYGWIE